LNKRIGIFDIGYAGQALSFTLSDNPGSLLACLPAFPLSLACPMTLCSDLQPVRLVVW
jgi:hypothetical protein